MRSGHLWASPIKRYPVQLLVSAGHPLAHRETVRLRDIAAETFVDMPEEFGQRRLADDAFTKAELSRRVVIEVFDITTIADYVAHGPGVALLPPDLVERAGETARAVPLADVLTGLVPDQVAESGACTDSWGPQQPNAGVHTRRGACPQDQLLAVSGSSRR
ncbi:LysR substrate-binding domain-containing protein [Streptomyces sp. NPDC056910]|uniref:LysR substrate-binding domain-containing protein n=1 Tax=Streptomyces sp. NPDC056910 TaxID=3345964 RepID=UPI0036904BFA